MREVARDERAVDGDRERLLGDPARAERRDRLGGRARRRRRERAARARRPRASPRAAGAASAVLDGIERRLQREPVGDPGDELRRAPPRRGTRRGARA